MIDNSKNKLVKIKWISGVSPVIIVKRNDARLYINRRELIALKEEINDFINFYSDQFSEDKIDSEDTETDLEWNIIHDTRND